MMSQLTVKRLINPSDNDIKTAANVLHRAFSRKYFIWALENNESLVEPFLLGYVKATILGGEIWVAELPKVGVVGVALWFGPGQKCLSSEKQRMAGWSQIVDNLDSKYRDWWYYFLSAADSMRDKLYGPGKHLASYHLHTFGVLPQHQSNGYGTALMKSMEIKAVAAATDIVLETAGEGAVPIYENMGFEVLGPEPFSMPDGAKFNGYGFRKYFRTPE